MITNRKQIVREIALLREKKLSWLEIADQVKGYWPGADRKHVAWSAQALYNSKSARKMRADDRFLQVAGCAVNTRLDTAGNVISCESRVLYSDEI